MMVRSCDRCHQTIPGAMSFGWVLWGDRAPHDHRVGDLETGKDLCLACLADLRAWMDPATYHAQASDAADLPFQPTRGFRVIFDPARPVPTEEP